MAMKAYACPRCLTLASETEDGDGGPHTCTPTPLVRGLEARIAELESKKEPSMNMSDPDQMRVLRECSIRLTVDSINDQLREHGVDMQFDPEAFT